MSPAFGGWEKEKQAGHRTLPVPGCGKVEKPQKVGSKPERRERACKRTAQAQRDFLRGGAATRTVKPHFAQKNVANHKGSSRRGCGGHF